VTLDFKPGPRVGRCRLLPQPKDYSHVIKVRKGLAPTGNPVAQEMTSSILCGKGSSRMRRYISQESVIGLKTPMATVMVDALDEAKINCLPSA